MTSELTHHNSQYKMSKLNDPKQYANGSISRMISMKAIANGLVVVVLATVVRQSDAFVSSSTSYHQRQGVIRASSLMAKVELTPEEHAIAMEKATKAMTAFTNKYLELSVTKLCSDKSVPAVVIKGLAEHKVTLGAPLCPCRFYDDKEAEAKDGFWNCPCVPMRERSECHCMLFLNDDNQFAGQETNISYDEVITLAAGMDA